MDLMMLGWFSWVRCPVWAPGCKNRTAPFPGWMSYKATNPGSVCSPLA